MPAADSGGNAAARQMAVAPKAMGCLARNMAKISPALYYLKEGKRENEMA